MDKCYTESAVLFITFARPEYAEQSFNAICMAKPRYLYFYNNAPRKEMKMSIQNVCIFVPLSIE